MADDQVQAILRDNWLGERITIEGSLSKVTDPVNPKQHRKVALVTDLKLILPNKEHYELSHSWLQKAEPLNDVPPGSRLRCTVKVRSYTKANGESAIGFTYPGNIEVINPPVFRAAVKEAIKEVQQRPIVQATLKSNLQTLIDLKANIERAGGKDKIIAVLAAIDALGGWEAIAAVKDLAASAGGADTLRAYLDLLFAEAGQGAA